MLPRKSPPTVVGSRYGRLVAVQLDHKKGRRPFWLFQCDCGVKRVHDLSNVRYGSIRSCGCGTLDAVTKHGSSGSREYRTWMAMRRRCLDPDHMSFDLYGGKGVTICEPWIHSFEEFFRALGPSPGAGYTIDRIENDRGYEPGNVKWSTAKQQARNRTNSVVVELGGETINFAEACERYRQDYRMVARRLKRGWALLQALTEPPRTDGSGNRL